MNRILFTAPVALIASALFVSASIAPANAGDDAVCSATPAQLRTAAETAAPEAAGKALKTIKVGEALCEAGNERAAAKKFKLAQTQLGVQQASAEQPMAAN